MVIDSDDQILMESIRGYYLKILGREPDLSGLEFHLKKIKSNEIKIEQLPEILKNSPEFFQLQKNGIKKQANSLVIDDKISLDNTIIKQVDDHFLLLDKDDEPTLQAFSQSGYEKTTVSLLKKILNEGMNAINIGANIGYFTLIMAKCVGEQGHIISFEPFQRTSEILKKNVEINGYSNIEIVTKGVSNTTKNVDLWVGGGSVYNFISEKSPEHDPRLQKITIEAISIDEFFKNKKMNIHLAQIDAEGSEKYILEGMQEIIKKNPSMNIIIEYNPYTLELTGTSGGEFLELIVKMGFYIYLIDEKENKIKLYDKEQILKDFDKPEVVNLLLTRIKNEGYIFK